MNLLDRYIFRSVLLTCAGAVGLFAFVLTAGNVVRDLLPYVLAGQLSAGLSAVLVVDTIVAVTTYALPMGILTGVLLTLGRLSADSEITAMRAGGLSLPRIARPVVLLALLGMALGLYINFESMPRSKISYERQLTEAVSANPLRLITPKTFIRNFRNLVLYVDEKDGPLLRDVWIWQLDDAGRAVQLLHAAEARVSYLSDTNELVVTFNRALLEMRDKENPEDFSNPPMIGSSEALEPVHLPLGDVLGRKIVHQKPQWMTYAELRAEQRRRAAEPVPPAGSRQHASDVMQIALVIQDKFNLAVAIFSFGLLGVPLGIKVSRRETSANLGVAVLLALGYYFLSRAASWLSPHPEYRPDLLLWVPNLIFIGLSVWLFRRIDRR